MSEPRAVATGSGGTLRKLSSPLDPVATAPGSDTFVVDDIGSATKKAAALGARIVKDSVEVPDMGWLSIIEDPTGAALGLGKQKLLELVDLTKLRSTNQ